MFKNDIITSINTYQKAVQAEYNAKQVICHHVYVTLVWHHLRKPDLDPYLKAYPVRDPVIKLIS